VQNVRHNVHPRVVPLDKLSVVPNDVANAGRLYVFRFAIFREHGVLLLQGINWRNQGERGLPSTWEQKDFVETHSARLILVLLS